MPQIWKDYDEEAEQALVVPENPNGEALKPEYLDVIISDVRTHNGFAFSIQILNTEGEALAILSTKGCRYLILRQVSHRWRS